MNPHFVGQPEFEQCPDGRNFKIVKAFGFWTPRTGLINVPAGFVTDLASIPRLFWDILPPFGTYTNAAILHDYIYRAKIKIMSRKSADLLLWEAMKLSNVRWLARWIIYHNVRWFGQSAWRGDSIQILK